MARNNNMHVSDDTVSCSAWSNYLKVKTSLCFFNWAPRHGIVLGEWRCNSTHCWPRH